MPATLFTNVAIFDGTGAAPFPGEVLIDGARIAVVARGAAPRIDRARAAAVIDGGGGTLMPGLIEPHAHLTFTSSVGRIVKEFMPPVEAHAFYAAHNARVLLDHGYTSAFSGGATRPAIEVRLRDEIAAFYLPGPRLKAASFERAIDGTRQGDGAGVEAVRGFCQEMIALGVDSMKFILSGAGSVFAKNFDTLTYSEPELEAARDLARDAGVNLLGHAYNSESIRRAIRYGFHAIYHCNFADEPTLDLMEKHKDEFFVVPAVGIIVAGVERKDEILPGAVETHDGAAEGLQAIYEAQMRVVPEMHKRGIRVLPGGDYGFAHNPHGRNAWDIELFATRFGFTPAEALAAATSGAAGIMGMADRIGQVKEGHLADLILVDGNPVAEIALLQDKARILAILQEGKFHKRPAAREPARVAAE